MFFQLVIEPNSRMRIFFTNLLTKLHQCITGYQLAKCCRFFDGTATNEQFCINITTIQESLVESTEDFTVELSDPSNGVIVSPSSTTINIMDDDAGKSLSFKQLMLYHITSHDFAWLLLRKRQTTLRYYW